MEKSTPERIIRKNIAIYGAGGFGREVLMLIEQINDAQTSHWNMIGWFDDGLSAGQVVANYPVLGGLLALNAVSEALYIVIAIGNPIVKKDIVHRIINKQIQFPYLIHPGVAIGHQQRVRLGVGCIICAGNILTVDITIGNHVILNLACTVGHDTVIGDFCSFMPAVNISGEVLFRECVYAGTGVKIINQVEIGAGTILGAGATVTKSLPAYCTAVGSPAKPIKFHTVSELAR